MPTPMHVFNEIAARYGADPGDNKSVRDFFTKKLATLPPQERQAIMNELLARDGETKPSSQTPGPV